MRLIKVFFHMNIVDAVFVGILCSVILVILSYVFYQGVKEWIVNKCKQRARKLLKDEFSALKNELQHYKEKWLGKQDIILSKTIVERLIQFLPNPNECVHNLSLIKKKQRIEGGTFEFRTVSFYPGESIKIEIFPLNIVFSVIHRKDSIKANMCGVVYDVTTYCWDFNASGIRLIGDNDFYRIISLVVHGNEAAQETGLLDYNK